MKHFSVLLFSLLMLSGCTVRKQPEMKDTPECQTYRLMATAPLDPFAHEALRQKCAESCKRYAGFAYSDTMQFWAVCTQNNKTTLAGIKTIQTRPNTNQ